EYDGLDEKWTHICYNSRTDRRNRCAIQKVRSRSSGAKVSLLCGLSPKEAHAAPADTGKPFSMMSA
ncbi:unnamed protein product, partial [Nesidiocoris tenuis]